MSLRNLPIESGSDVQIVDAYMCDKSGCNRCYNEAAGYFDFIAGRPQVAIRQTLCESDAHPMFLESVNFHGRGIWRCPECGAAEGI